MAKQVSDKLLNILRLEIELIDLNIEELNVIDGKDFSNIPKVARLLTEYYVARTSLTPKEQKQLSHLEYEEINKKLSHDIEALEKRETIKT